MASECFVINKADWDQLMLVLSGMCLLLTVTGTPRPLAGSLRAGRSQ